MFVYLHICNISVPAFMLFDLSEKKPIKMLRNYQKMRINYPKSNTLFALECRSHSNAYIASTYIDNSYIYIYMYFRPVL